MIHGQGGRAFFPRLKPNQPRHTSWSASFPRLFQDGGKLQPRRNTRNKQISVPRELFETSPSKSWNVFSTHPCQNLGLLMVFFRCEKPLTFNLQLGIRLHQESQDLLLESVFGTKANSWNNIQMCLWAYCKILVLHQQATATCPTEETQVLEQIA